MLPVCKTFNIIIHNLLQKMSTCCMTLYLEKLKIIHMTFTIGLILVSCEWVYLTFKYIV